MSMMDKVKDNPVVFAFIIAAISGGAVFSFMGHYSNILERFKNSEISSLKSKNSALLARLADARKELSKARDAKSSCESRLLQTLKKPKFVKKYVLSKKDPYGRLYSKSFSHISDRRRDITTYETGIYGLRIKDARIYKVVFSHHDISEKSCALNFNPDGGHGGKVEIIDGGKAFRWFRKWSGKPCVERYDAFYEMPTLYTE